jgi:dihydrofolate reductase
MGEHAMGKVIFEHSMSLDGFSTGPDVSVEVPMGIDGEQLHDWLFQGDAEVDGPVAEESMALAGATIIGRRMFDLGLEPWGGTPYPGSCFVLTHESRPDLVMANGTFTFVTEGIERAVALAKAAAGDRHVVILGGADVGRQAIRAGLVDEIRLHLAHVLLGAGIRLFDGIGAPPPVRLERVGPVASGVGTHLRFRLTKSDGGSA